MSARMDSASKCIKLNEIERLNKRRENLKGRNKKTVLTAAL